MANQEGTMLENSKAYSGIGVKDVDEAQRFYGETLGLPVEVIEAKAGLLQLQLAGDRPTLLYRSPDMSPASYTVLNFPVEDVEAAVDQLAERGVTFERYDGFEQDEKGISHGPGPTIAWFKDPSGNIISVHSQVP